ncbi:glutamine synthetase family protein [Elongatibacter sediminis]|uniref:Glutamine synthetase family protein n=1 Tax=Elongatibacter sediminis TaxID=3119006 RepID=A0AAW9RHZ9_9GAMM
MDFEQLKDWLQSNRITEIECLVPDIAGIARGKITPAKKYLREESIRLPESLFGQTVTGDWPEDDVYEKIVDPAERDMHVAPDPGTVRFVPWAHEPTAQIIHDCYYQDMTPVPYAPRQLLKRVLQAYEEEGWRPVVAPELEFFLTEVNKDPDNPLEPPTGRSGRKETARKSFGIDAVNEFDPLFEQMYDFCEAQELEIDTLIHEEGAAQMEINFQHGDALDLCDQVFLFKRTVRETAILHKCYATFMAKPMEEEPGSAMHVHQSVISLKSQQNIFTNEDGSPSDRFRWFIGGQQKYLNAAIPFFAPNVNSYRRLAPGYSAPINSHWAEDNRTVGLRVPGSDGANRRIEHRVSGADVNPYIAVAAMLATGLLGIREQVEPSAAIEGSAHHLPHALPRTIEEGFRYLDACESLVELMHPRFVELYKAVKMAEHAEFQQVISSWEREFLLLNV